MASLTYRKTRTNARSAMYKRMRDAKARKHLEATRDESLRVDAHGLLLWAITLHNCRTGRICSLDLRVSKRRLNSFDVSVDGKPWKDKMSASRVAAAIRKKIVPPHWLEME